ncbi:MAG: hypothetical protein J6A01_05725 [Proteobacteria bacterium]|nr:hypothetical protein [Pseudomonadota bacterium]
MMTRRRRFKRTNQIKNPLVVIVIGIIGLSIGLLMLRSEYNSHGDWDEVEVSYQEINCHEEVENTHKKNGKPKETTYCDLMMSYNYNGKLYEKTETHVRHEPFRSGTLKIDPANPENYSDNYLNLFGEILIVFGLLISIGGAVFMVRTMRGEPE